MSEITTINEKDENGRPKGVGFYSVETDETRYAQLEPQIQAYINSSDMGINASRDQDFGWRLAAPWVKAVRAFRRNEAKMEILTNKNGGNKVTTTQILFAIYGEQLRAAQQYAEDNARPFEGKYAEDIKEDAPVQTADEEELDNFDKVADQEEPTPAPADPGSADKAAKAAAKKK